MIEVFVHTFPTVSNVRLTIIGEDRLDMTAILTKEDAQKLRHDLSVALSTIEGRINMKGEPE